MKKKIRACPECLLPSCSGEMPPAVSTRSSVRRSLSPSPSEVSRPELLPRDKWIGELDLAAFKADVGALGKTLRAAQGPADVAHLKKIMLWANTCLVLGVATMGLSPKYIFPALLLSTATFARWTMIAHHTCHGGYDRIDLTKRHNRFTFAVGGLWRRATDWFDWMLPEAWNVEHNNEHHYHLGELSDPDLLENNMQSVRDDASTPLWVKYANVFFLMATWKWLYYAPNTWKQLQLQRMRASGQEVPADAATMPLLLTSLGDTKSFGSWLERGRLFSEVLLPYFIARFLLTPLPVLLLFGKTPFLNAVANLLLAELFTNVHSAIAIMTNHAGNDLYRFATGCKAKSGTFYMRQVISSSNFWCGGDLNDFMHGWLNYQIEHHVWPDLSMLSYQKGHPLMKAICEKHGVPYVQQNVFTRCLRTWEIMVGTADMRKFPLEWERPL